VNPLSESAPHARRLFAWGYFGASERQAPASYSHTARVTPRITFMRIWRAISRIAGRPEDSVAPAWLGLPTASRLNRAIVLRPVAGKTELKLKRHMAVIDATYLSLRATTLSL
jgi:hypothetical protein